MSCHTIILAFLLIYCIKFVVVCLTWQPIWKFTNVGYENTSAKMTRCLMLSYGKHYCWFNVKARKCAFSFRYYKKVEKIYIAWSPWHIHIAKNISNSSTKNQAIVRSIKFTIVSYVSSFNLERCFDSCLGHQGEGLGSYLSMKHNV